MTLNRRDFLKLSASLCASSAILLTDYDSTSKGADALDDLKIERHTLNVGAERPFTAVHISDTHITFSDTRDTERTQKLAESRSKYFSKAERFFLASAEYAKQKDALLLHTGDMIDFLSEKNLEYVKNFYDQTGNDARFVSAGNHEYSHYLGEAKEDEAYKAQSFDRVQKSFPNDLRFASKIVNGVNFVAFDDVYHYVADNIIELFEKEVEKGLPIVTLCHVPFFTPELYRVQMEEKKERFSYLLGAPDTKRESSDRFLSWLKTQPLFKAHLSGHLHYNHVCQFSDRATQYVVGGNFQGCLYEFNFV
ncbi:MAG: metallophosphoesterase family protein [Thermoguttaceae bacterium]